MDMMLIFVYAFLSVYGLYLIGTALYWRLISFPVKGQIIGFQKKRSKGRKLPVVEFYDRDDNAIRTNVLKIDHVGYIISSAMDGDTIPLRHAKKNAKNVRISGYFWVVCGLLLQLPMLSFISLNYLTTDQQTELAFLVYLFLVLGIAWVIMRLIRFSY